MWSPSLRAPPLWLGACFLSCVSAFCLPPRRRRYAPSPVGGCVLPLLFRGCRLRRRCPFSLVRPPLWRRCSALCVRAFRFPSPPHAASDAPLWRRGRPFLSPSQSRSRIFRVSAVRAARSLRAFKTLLRALCAAERREVSSFEMPCAFRTARTESVRSVSSACFSRL